MATATKKRYTPEDLLRITDRPMPELVNGRLVEREPMGQEADAVCLTIGHILMKYAQNTLPGLVNTSSCGYQIFPDDPNKVRIPDASFTRRERLSSPHGARGHSKVVPELIVEVISPRDKAEELYLKLWDYHRAGVPWVWVVNPRGKTVQTIHADGNGTLLGPEDMLDGGDILPGFSCRVAALFE